VVAFATQHKAAVHGIPFQRVLEHSGFGRDSINAVYSNTLNKWLWIDPTNDAYAMNEKGELLSIAEDRHLLY